ncbi:hypothetical protein J437_LFUL004021 [Ladona fulva]|uniref:Plexin TIG domain-containing protein n=1 Tax=Ladona fulva TaxID=123851 RepID=A0A8K0JZG4_LADFU|nr:hypothetical protein J437_LFUL004021 [Ladona fulva]
MLVRYPASLYTSPYTYGRTYVQLTIKTLPDLPSGAKYRCVFGNAEPIDASVTAAGLSCPTPPVSSRPSIPEDKDHVLVPLSVRSSETNKDFVSRNFAFFDCALHVTCMDCVKSQWACNWCVYENKCSYNTTSCQRTVISGENVRMLHMLQQVGEAVRAFSKNLSALSSGEKWTTICGCFAAQNIFETNSAERFLTVFSSRTSINSNASVNMCVSSIGFSASDPRLSRFCSDGAHISIDVLGRLRRCSLTLVIIYDALGLNEFHVFSDGDFIPGLPAPFTSKGIYPRINAYVPLPPVRPSVSPSAPCVRHWYSQKVTGQSPSKRLRQLRSTFFSNQYGATLKLRARTFTRGELLQQSNDSDGGALPVMIL